MDRAVVREAELLEGREPVQLEGIARLVQVVDHPAQILPDEMRQHETVMQFGAPVDQRAGVGRLPEMGHQRADQQHLQRAHLPVWRHLEIAELDNAQPAAGAIRRVELVDAELCAVGVAREIHQEIAQDAIHQPVLSRLFLLQLLQGNLQFVEIVVAGFVHAWRLARRSDELPGEQVGKAGMVLPEAQQTAQQIRTSQERTVLGLRRAECHMIAAARAGVPAIEHELLRAQAVLPRLFIKRVHDMREFRPAASRLHIDFDDARVWGDHHFLQTWIAGRLVTLYDQRTRQFLRRRLDSGNQSDIALEVGLWWQEQIKPAIPHFGAKCRMKDAAVARVAGVQRFGVFIDQKRVGKILAWREWIACVFLFILLGHFPRQTVQRQPETDRGVARNQRQLFLAEVPAATQPAYGAFEFCRCQRQDIAGLLVQSVGEDSLDAGALQRINDLVVPE